MDDGQTDVLTLEIGLRAIDRAARHEDDCRQTTRVYSAAHWPAVITGAAGFQQ
jgi:hypothetical protein